MVQSSSQFEIVVPPSFSLTVFRLRPPPDAGVDKTDTAALNILNRIFHARLLRADLFLTQTDISGTFAIRLAIGSTRTEEEHIKRAFDIMVREAGPAINEWEKSRKVL